MNSNPHIATVHDLGARIDALVAKRQPLEQTLRAKKEKLNARRAALDLDIAGIVSEIRQVQEQFEAAHCAVAVGDEDESRLPPLRRRRTELESRRAELIESRDMPAGALTSMQDEINSINLAIGQLHSARSLECRRGVRQSAETAAHAYMQALHVLGARWSEIQAHAEVLASLERVQTIAREDRLAFDVAQTTLLQHDYPTPALPPFGQQAGSAGIALSAAAAGFDRIRVDGEAYKAAVRQKLAQQGLIDHV